MRYKVLNKNNEFKRCYTRGKSYVNAFLITYIIKNRLGYTRYGITSSKKVGNAVTRNRARRLIRVAMQQLLPLNAGGYDIVFVARSATAKQKAYKIEKTMKNQLESAGLLKKDD